MNINIMGNWFSNKFEESFPITIRNHKYGWTPDIPDQRDQYVAFPDIAKFKSMIDLRDTNLLPDVYDQGNLGSCTANALCTAFEYEYKRQFNGSETDIISPSRLFLYYNERVIENSVGYDSGASIRDGIKVLNKLGVCKESMCPYNIQTFDIKPTVNAYLDAQNYKSIKYKKLSKTLDSIKSALTLSYPVSFGFSVYESFEDPDGVSHTGIFNIPAIGEKILGGHAVLIVGYNDETDLFLIRNSWGEDWGPLGGYFWMPYEFIISDSCSDFWIIEKIKKPTDYRTMADIVRGYQIREDDYSSEEDDNNEDDCIKKSESKSSIVELELD
jgi:C1A family cysteine protease